MISYKDFVTGCKRLVEGGFVPWAWKSGDTTWSWWVPEGREEDSHLNRLNSRCCPRYRIKEASGTGYDEDDRCSVFKTAAQQDLDSSEREKAGGIHCSQQDAEMLDQYVVIEFHTCYSASYQEPVLYIHAYLDSGTVMGMQDIKQCCTQVLQLSHNGHDCNSSKNQSDIEWPMMTQESHPVTQAPCYMVHPCDTGDAMKILLEVGVGGYVGPREQTSYGARYLLAWLSIVGQPFGLVPSVKDMKQCGY
eukprot:jgi/Picsp_1/2326/NSC_05789-R1_ubiquitin-like-conjugating enzyme atg10-like